MIFHPDLAAKITLGEKNVTRRPVKRDARGHLFPCTYQPGRTYAVQLHRGGFAVDRVCVVDVTRETLVLPLTWTEARLEGFDSPAAFTERWAALYGKEAPTDVWRIQFELVGGTTSAGNRPSPESDAARSGSQQGNK